MGLKGFKRLKGVKGVKGSSWLQGKRSQGERRIEMIDVKRAERCAFIEGPVLAKIEGTRSGKGWKALVTAKGTNNGHSKWC